jgi:hypothetical protein
MYSIRVETQKLGEGEQQSSAVLSIQHSRLFRPSMTPGRTSGLVIPLRRACIHSRVSLLASHPVGSLALTTLGAAVVFVVELLRILVGGYLFATVPVAK